MPLGRFAGCAVADRFPATYLQEWYADAHDSGLSDLSVSVAVPLPHDYDETCLRLALADLAARHEAFRTTLVRTPAGLRQEVAAAGSVPLAEPGTAHEPFRVVGGPLVWAEPLAAAVVVHAHHAVCDGWSTELVRRDLAELYRARSTGCEPVLPRLDLQFADYASWEHTARHLPPPEYWLTRLDRPRPRLAADSDADQRPARLRTVPLPRVQATAARQLEVLAAVLQTTMSRLLGAVAVATLLPFAGDGIVIGQIMSNRHRPELRNVVGDLWDQVPVPVDLSGLFGPAAFAELAARYDEAVTGAQDHHVPVAVLAPVLRPGPGPLFDVRVNHFPDIGHADAPPPRPLTVDRWWTGLSLIDFQFRTRADGGVDGALLVNEAAVPTARVAEITRRFGQTVTDAAAVRC